MTRFRSRETLDAPLDQVARWHSLPGALTRLSPHWAQEVRREGDPNRPGSHAEMRISAPGTYGTVRVPWKSEHFALEGVPLLDAVQREAGLRQAGFGDRMVSTALSPMSAWEHRHTFRSVPGFGDDGGGAVEGAAGDGAVEGDGGHGLGDSPAQGTAAEDSGTGSTEIDDTVDFTLRGADRLSDLAAHAKLGKLAQAVGVDDRIDTALEQTFAARTGRLRRELAFLRSIDAPTVGGDRVLNVLVTGASGLVGTQLTALLAAAGHRVRALSRRPPRSGLDNNEEDYDVQPFSESAWEPSLGLVKIEDLAWADVVVHLAGRSIGGRLTAAAKQEIESSRIDSTRLLVSTIAELPAEQRPEAFVCASAVGYYGTDRREPVTEDAGPGDGFLAELCSRWEDEAARVEEAGVRRVSVRTGLVMSSLGGLLRLQLPLYLAGAGGPLGTGEQWFPWISHDDMVRVYAHTIVSGAVEGPVNAAAPRIVTQKEFSEVLGSHVRRPAVLPVPRVGPALLLGEEGADELALAGQHAVPAALQESGFEFAHPSLDECLDEELGSHS